MLKTLFSLITKHNRSKKKQSFANSLLYHLYEKFPFKRSILLLLKRLYSLCLTCLSHINGKTFLKTLDFKEEKLQKHRVEVIIFNDCQIQHYLCFSNI